MKQRLPQHGFTLVELIVTLVVAGIFIGIIAQMNASVVNITMSAHRFDLASNLAYNNLRIYANGQSATKWFECNGDVATDTATATKPFSDGVKYPEADGMLLINTTSTTSIYDLPPPVIQKVTAFAPYGCGASDTTGLMPVRVVSTVTYGSPARKVVHATYVNN